MGKHLLAVCAILCTALLGVAIAQQNSEQKPKTDQPKQEQPAKVTKAATFEVVSVDATKREIVIKDEAGAETRLLITESTKVSRDGKPITLADVKGGDKLTFECEEGSDPCKAKAVKIGEKPQG